MIDAVLSYHTNPSTCGVAKFSSELARRLGVPFQQLSARGAQHPLLSIKFQELIDNGADPAFTARPLPWPAYDLFLHDEPMDPHVRAFVSGASRVWRAEDVGCPSLIAGDASRGQINVLTFGMAHKLQIRRYERLKALLDDQPVSYTVSLSTAIHEGETLEGASQVAERLRGVFGSHLRVLGHLADDALARELRECSAVALFFERGVRANNTTFWAAIESGKPVISNIDGNSPFGYCYDIDAMTAFPMAYSNVKIHHPYTWDNLLQTLQSVPCAS